tara:strand:- start:1154 stop:1768 length:615 start_codon:yes stop_codon:yes gene_type:complete
MNPQNNEIEDFITQYTNQLSLAINSIDIQGFKSIADLLESTIKSGKTIFTSGNGGSSSIAEHFVCDFLKGTATSSTIQPIIHSLTSNTPTITAVANDICYEEIFSHQIAKYGKSGDVLLSISSSGNSENIIRGIEKAKALNIKTISFVGFDGGRAKLSSDYSIHIPVKNYGVVEDTHHSLMHMLAQYLRLKNLKDEDNVEKIIF